MENFQSHLEEELKLHISLKDIISEETKVIIKRDVARLEEIIEEKKKFFLHIEQLELKRTELQKEISQKMGRSSLLNLRDLCNILPPDITHSLKKLRDDLKRVLNRITRLNKINSTLLKRYIDYSSFYMKKLKKISSVGAGTYSASGYMNNTEPTRSLLVYQRV